MSTRGYKTACLFGLVLLIISFIPSSTVLAEPIRATWVNGRRYYVDINTGGQSAEIWLRVRAYACGPDDIKLANLTIAEKRLGDVKGAICRYKPYYDWASGVLGCGSLVGTGICAYAMVPSAGALAAVCNVVIPYSVSKGYVDCLSFVGDSIASVLKAKREWAMVQVHTGLSTGQFEWVISGAIDMACEDARK